jgi:SLT domain-containing protein
MATYYYQYPAITITSVALPTGASTEAKQDVGNTSLASIDSKLGSLGQKTMAGSAPVVIASDQSAIPASQSGTWNINNISGTISLPTGAATESTLSSMSGKLPSTLGQHAAAGSLSVVLASDQGAVPVSQSGTWDINNISGTVSLPTGAATSALQTTGNTSLSSIDGKLGSLGQKTMSGSAPVVIASDQSAIPASQSGTWDINNISGTVSLPTGAATSALQTAGNTSLSSIDSKLGTLGQKAMTGSAPVVIASDQSAIPISAPLSVNATYAQSTTLTTAAVTETAPANAVGFILFADDENTDAIRFALGATASTTTGAKLQAGRDTGFIPCGVNISLCAASGTQGYQLQWVRR